MRVIKYSLTTAAIALAAPVGAQTVPKDCSASMPAAVAHFRAWFQARAGNPCYGPDDALKADAGVQALACRIEMDKAIVPVATPDAAALATARREGAGAVKAAVTAAMAGF